MRAYEPTQIRSRSQSLTDSGMNQDELRETGVYIFAVYVLAGVETERRIEVHSGSHGSWNLDRLNGIEIGQTRCVLR